MLTRNGRFDPTRFEDLTVTVDFHCHSACRFCIVQEGMNEFRGVSEARLRRAVDDNARTRRYRRLCFTGGEVTLEKKLFDYLAIARESHSFEHMRLQTNGRLLADRAFAQRLVDAGVDEYFVSLHGHDAATQDAISQRPGSFDQALAGIRNLSELGVCLMTNTVINTMNVDTLAEMVETVAPFEPVRMEFWNYLPMEDYADERNLLAPMRVVGPEIRRALGAVRAHGFEARVKYVPRCLLGEFQEWHDDAQPDVLIAEKFYDPYPKFACIYEAKCEHSETCLGLTHPYIAKHGWEEERLVPVPRTRPYIEPDDGPAVESDQPGQGATASALDHPEWRALVQGVEARHAVDLQDLRVTRRTCVFGYRVSDAALSIVLTARDEGSQAVTQTRSFNVNYRVRFGADDRADRDRRPFAAFVRDVIQTIADRDRGTLLLDVRKGLVGDEAERHLSRPRAAARAGARGDAGGEEGGGTP